jgi:ribosomal protein L29
MNSDLAKAGVYNKLTQKQITALADLRNKAAHGQWEEFTKGDVDEMRRSIQRIMTKYRA